MTSICIYSMVLIYKLGDFLHINWSSWYFDPPIHGILTPLPMLYWPPYPWYIDNPTHGILNPFPWNIEPLMHGILTPLAIEYRPPTHDILTSLHIFLLLMGGFKIPWGFNLPYRGGSVFNKGVQYTMDVNRPRVQFTMGFKIPYDIGIATVRIVRYIRNISE